MSAFSGIVLYIMLFISFFGFIESVVKKDQKPNWSLFACLLGTLLITAVEATINVIG